MDKFLVRSRRSSTRDDRLEVGSPRCLQPQPNLVLQYELTGRMNKRLEKLGLITAMKSYALVHTAETSEASNGIGIPRRTWISDIAFNTEGDLVAWTTYTGAINVENYQRIASWKTMPPARYVARDKLHAVRWDPLEQFQLACVCGAEARVAFFDIRDNHSEPVWTLLTKLDSAARSGLYDVQCRSWSVFACGDRGVYMWDRRAARTCSSVLEAPAYAGKILSLDVMPDDQILFGGSQNGHILMWDLRGGKTSSSAFSSPASSSRPPVRTMSISKAMASIPHLQSQTGSICVSVTCLRLHPFGSRLAFGLNTGWAGAINLANLGNLTHIYCPPSPWNLGNVHWSGLTKIAWLPDLPVVAVGAGDLRFLDFSESGSRYHVSREEQDSCAPIALEMGLVDSLAAHPSEGTLIVGSQNSLNLVAHHAADRTGERAA